VVWCAALLILMMKYILFHPIYSSVSQMNGSLRTPKLLAGEQFVLESSLGDFIRVFPGQNLGELLTQILSQKWNVGRSFERFAWSRDKRGFNSNYLSANNSTFVTNYPFAIRHPLIFFCFDRTYPGIVRLLFGVWTASCLWLASYAGTRTGTGKFPIVSSTRRGVFVIPFTCFSFFCFCGRLLVWFESRGIIE